MIEHCKALEFRMILMMISPGSQPASKGEVSCGAVYQQAELLPIVMCAQGCLFAGVLSFSGQLHGVETFPRHVCTWMMHEMRLVMHTRSSVWVGKVPICSVSY